MVSDAVVASCLKFDDLRRFVSVSNASLPTGDTTVRVFALSGWIVLAYGLLEGGYRAVASACRQYAGQKLTVEALPQAAQRRHRETALEYILKRGLGGSLPDRSNAIHDIGFALSTIEGSDWSLFSRLLELEGNASPDRILKACTEVGMDRGDLAWMKEPAANGDGSETLESRVNGLVRDRNVIAHGDQLTNLLGASEMLALIDDVSEFIRRVGATFCLWLHRTSPECTGPPVGYRARPGCVDLTATTIPFAFVNMPVEVGDFLLVEGFSGVSRLARVESIMQRGAGLKRATPGMREVAVCLDRRIGTNDVLRVMP